MKIRERRISCRDVLFEFLNSTLKWIPPVLVFQWEVYYKVDRLLTGLTARQKGTTAQWYSNKTSLDILEFKQCVYRLEIKFPGVVQKNFSNQGILKKEWVFSLEGYI